MARVDDYVNAFNLAREELSNQDPGWVANRSGSEYVADPAPAVLLPFNGRTVKIRFDYMDVEPLEGDTGREITVQEKVLVLHYLLGARGFKPTGKWITYREIPSGEFYYPAFRKRAIDPLVNTFGNDAESLKEIARKMGGVEEPGVAGTAFQFHPFPLVPMVLQLHEGDDEFPADGNVLFDETVARCLSLEDIAWLAGTVVYPLVGIYRSRSK